MKLLSIIPLAIIAAVFLLKSTLGTNTNNDKILSDNINNIEKPKNEFSFTTQASETVKQKLSSMTLKEKIAQMVIANIIPENLDENSGNFKKYRELCQQTKVGGFIFFKGNSYDYVRIANKLQSLSETPLLISADFERGTKMRVTDGALFPNNMAIGAADNPELCYKMGMEIARETRLLGVHQNYSPVCDINNNPKNPIINVRSFGEDPALVSRMSEAMIKGLQDGKVIATAKHFPGHGDTEIDSHSDLPVLNFSMDRLNSMELVPFKNAVDKKVMSVMIAHLSFPELESDSHIPASLSPNVVENLLINKMGFNGLVVTDALNMKGITKYYSTADVAVMCVEAGIDLILMPMNEETTVDAIEGAVINGRIKPERIDRSVEKILKAKEWLGLFQSVSVQEADVWKMINTQEASEIAGQIADESITLVKDNNNALPFKDASQKTAVIVISEGGESDNISYLNSNLPNYFSNYDFIASENLETGSVSSYENVIIAVYAKVKYGTGKISITRKNADLIEKINDLNKNTVVVSLGSPYLLKEFPSVNSYICAYGDSDVSIEAVLKSLTGKIKFKGRLPVSITEDYKYGSGIKK